MSKPCSCAGTVVALGSETITKIIAALYIFLFSFPRRLSVGLLGDGDIEAGRGSGQVSWQVDRGLRVPQFPDLVGAGRTFESRKGGLPCGPGLGEYG